MHLLYFIYIAISTDSGHKVLYRDKNKVGIGLKTDKNKIKIQICREVKSSHSSTD